MLQGETLSPKKVKQCLTLLIWPDKLVFLNEHIMYILFSVVCQKKKCMAYNPLCLKKVGYRNKMTSTLSRLTKERNKPGTQGIYIKSLVQTDLQFNWVEKLSIMKPLRGMLMLKSTKESATVCTASVSKQDSFYPKAPLVARRKVLTSGCSLFARRP